MRRDRAVIVLAALTLIGLSAPIAWGYLRLKPAFETAGRQPQPAVAPAPKPAPAPSPDTGTVPAPDQRRLDRWAAFGASETGRDTARLLDLLVGGDALELTPAGYRAGAELAVMLGSADGLLPPSPALEASMRLREGGQAEIISALAPYAHAGGGIIEGGALLRKTVGDGAQRWYELTWRVRPAGPGRFDLQGLDLQASEVAPDEAESLLATFGGREP